MGELCLFSFFRRKRSLIMSQKKHKNRVLKYILIALLIIVVLIGLFIAMNYKNVVAFYKGLTTDSGTLSQQLEQNKKDTADALVNSGLNISEEDLNKINDGSLSKEEISNVLLNSMGKTEDVSQSGAEQNQPETGQQNEPSIEIEKNEDVSDVTGKDNQKVTEQEKLPEQEKDEKILSEQEYNKKLADLVAQVYVIQANFNATLNAFESRIISEYKALPAEQRTASTKAKIVSDNMAYVVGLEAQCDAQIKEVTDALTKLMTENNKDTSLVDSINKAYQNEKELKKAYYISLYK